MPPATAGYVIETTATLEIGKTRENVKNETGRANRSRPHLMLAIGISSGSIVYIRRGFTAQYSMIPEKSKSPLLKILDVNGSGCTEADNQPRPRIFQ